MFLKMIFILNQTFSVSLNSFSTGTYFVLLELTFLLSLVRLVSKFVFVIKFACTNLAAKNSAINLLISGVVMYLS